MAAEVFLSTFEEKAEHNQYWYSVPTIDVMVKEVLDSPGPRCAFLSTPSIFFSLPDSSDHRKQSVVFDLDEAFGKDPNVRKKNTATWEYA